MFNMDTTWLYLSVLCTLSVVCQAAGGGGSGGGGYGGGDGGGGDDSCPKDVATCTQEYCDMGGHVMCWTDSPDLQSSGVSAADIEVIVNKHNALRRQEPATDLFKVVWDADVALIAEKNTKSCKIEHDSNRGIPSYPDIGQNLAAGDGSWDSAIQGWYNEIQYFTYGMPPVD